MSRGGLGLHGGCLGCCLAPKALQELLFTRAGLHLPAHFLTFKDFLTQSLLFLDLQPVLTGLLILFLILTEMIKKIYIISRLCLPT